eukprot:SAG11_NODE_2764_length_2999_cov_2.267931_1_plen_85_part_00
MCQICDPRIFEKSGHGAYFFLPLPLTTHRWLPDLSKHGKRRDQSFFSTKERVYFEYYEHKNIFKHGILLNLVGRIRKLGLLLQL